MYHLQFMTDSTESGAETWKTVETYTIDEGAQALANLRLLCRYGKTTAWRLIWRD